MSNVSDKTLVSITLAEYRGLKADREFLFALQELGVDNWDGYSEAYKLAQERISEDKR